MFTSHKYSSSIEIFIQPYCKIYMNHCYVRQQYSTPVHTWWRGCCMVESAWYARVAYEQIESFISKWANGMSEPEWTYLKLPC